MHHCPGYVFPLRCRSNGTTVPERLLTKIVDTLRDSAACRSICGMMVHFCLLVINFMSKRITPNRSRKVNDCGEAANCNECLTDRGHAVGLLGRDKNAWVQSTKYISRLETVTGIKIVYGHDKGVFMELKQIPEYYH